MLEESAHTHSSQIKKQAAMLALLSKTDAGSIPVQCSLLQQAHDTASWKPDIRAHFLNSAKQAMQAPHSNTNIEHKCLLLFFIKKIRGCPVVIAGPIVDALVSRPLDFPLPLLCVLVSQLPTDRIPESLITALQGKLSDRDYDDRKYARQALADLIPKLSAERVHELLTALQGKLSDRGHWVRYYACQALADLIPKLSTEKIHEIITSLQAKLEDRDSSVREHAGKALAALVPKLSTEKLREIITSLQVKLGDSASHVRKHACLALAAFAPNLDPEQIPDSLIPSLQAAKLEDSDSDVRRYARLALAALITKLSVEKAHEIITPQLVKLNARDVNVQFEAYETLEELVPQLMPEQIPDSLITELEVQFKRWDPCQAARVLAIIAPKLATEQIPDSLITVLLTKFTDPSSGFLSYKYVRKSLAALTPKLIVEKAHKIITELESRVKLNDSYVRLDAYQLLEELAPNLQAKQIPDSLITTLQSKLEDGCAQDREYAHKVLVGLAPHIKPETRFDLVQYLTHKLAGNTSATRGWFTWLSGNARETIAHLATLTALFPHLNPVAVSSLLIESLETKLEDANPEIRKAAWDAVLSMFLHCGDAFKRHYAGGKEIPAVSFKQCMLRLLFTLVEEQPSPGDVTALYIKQESSDADEWDWPEETNTCTKVK